MINIVINRSSGVSVDVVGCGCGEGGVGYGYGLGVGGVSAICTLPKNTHFNNTSCHILKTTNSNLLRRNS